MPVRSALPRRATACSIFERALDALPDGVLLVNAARKLVYANLAFSSLWNMPDEVLESLEDGRMLEFAMGQLVDPEAFRREVERLHPTTETSHDEVQLKDGRTFSRRSVPFEEDGKFNARIWIFTDITEAKSASVDHLTQLSNRMAFSRDFEPFVAAPADGLVRSVAIMDLDNFKKYNDMYGHIAGDDVLRQIGIIVRSHLHEADDLLFRIGGEEFLMAIRTRNAVDAFALFDAIRRSIQAMKKEHLGNEPHRMVTASLGVGSFQEARDPDGVFKRIDAALYRAKAAGRNVVVEAGAI